MRLHRFSNFIIGLTTVLSTQSGFSSQKETPVFTEEFLVREIRGRSSANKLLKAQKSQVDLGASMLQEIYQPQMKAQYQYGKSDEDGSIVQPVLSPQKSFSLGVAQKLPYGAFADLTMFHSAMSTADGTLQNDTQLGMRLSVGIDLWKNVFGVVDRNQIKTAELQKKRGELEEQVQIKKTENELRKVYWSLVAVDENLELTQELLNSAERQAKDALARKASGVADRGEVAKYQSLVESRRGSFLLFEYEKEQLLGALESQLDGFSGRGLPIAKISQDTGKQNQILACIDSLQKNVEPNFESTFSDELVGLLKMQLESELAVAGSHADWEIGLQGYIQTSGRANSMSGAWDSLSADYKKGYGVGVTFQLPLGGAKNRSEAALIVAKKMLLEGQTEQVLNEFKSKHITILKGLKLLAEGLKTQKINSENLNINFNEMRTKFNQGRVPLAMLISEQDLLFQSRLQEIQLKKMIAHTLLDYFSVFTNYPCDWNKI